MTSSTNDIQIASNALLLLGHTPITSFEEGTAGADIASNLYPVSYDFFLQMNRWRFATKKQQLSRLTEKPQNEFLYQFQLPPDLLYLIKIDKRADYEIYEDKLYCNLLEVSIDYTYKVQAFQLPAYYVKAFEFYLASQFALTLTGSLEKKASMEQTFQFHYKKAMYIDASQRPVTSFASNPYLDVREGG